ncbi:MAG: ABC transporter substrate-binding protein [Acidimicrobiia bacterium]|nr:ABC transporter substrate-binding protein [Acidimicrobiia bacterium]
MRRSLLTFTALVLLLAACSGSSTDTTAGPTDTSGEAPATTAAPDDTSAPETTAAPAVDGAEITIAIGSEPSTLDPHTRDDGGERAINDNIYETLLARDAEGNLQPLLAADLPTQVDDTTWDVTIRDGISFTNGNALDAAAVAGSFNRLIGLGDESEQSGFFGTIASVEAVDAMTVRFTTSGPDPVLPSRLYWLKVIDPSTADADGFDENPVGTGPYTFVAWNRGSDVVLEANADYWGGAPSVSKVTFRFIEEGGTRLSGLLGGDFDMITNLSPEDAAAVPKAVSVTGLEHPIFILSAIDGPTADVNVRKAMNMAIDKQALADALFGGRATVDQCQILGSNLFGFNPALEAYPYDPDTARQMVIDAGAEGATISVVGESGRWLKDRELIEAVANYWSEIGLVPDVQIYEFGEYLNRLFDRETRASAIFVSSSNDLLDPTRQLGNYYSSDGIGSSNTNEDLRQLVADGAVTTDVAAREGIYHQATQIACDEAYFAFLLNIEDSYGLSERLDYTPRLDGRLLVKDMTVTG